MADHLMRDLNANAAFMGILASAYFYPYAILQIPSGIFSDKYSPRKIISIAFIVTSFGTLLFAYAQNTSMAFLGRLGMGIGCALVILPIYKTLSNWFSPKIYMVIITTILAGAVGMASALAGAPLSHFVENFGWRASSQGIAVLSLVATACIWLFFKDTPPNTQQEKQIQEPSMPIWQSIKLILSKWNFWMITLAFTANASILFSFIAVWSGLYYIHAVDFTRAEMGSLLSISASITIFTPIIFASIAAKIKSRKNTIIVTTGALFACMVYLFVRNGSFSKDEVFAWCIVMSIIISAPAGLYMVTTRELFPKNIASTANGLIYSICMLGTALYQAFVGFLINNAGYVDALTASIFKPVSILYIITSGLGFFFMFSLKEKDKQLL